MSSNPLLKSQAEVDRFIVENEGLDIGKLVPLPHPYEEWKDKEIKSLTESQLADAADAVAALRSCSR